MRVFSVIPTILAIAALQILFALPAGAAQGVTPGYDREFSQFLQSQGARVQPSVVMIETRFTKIVHEYGEERMLVTEGDFGTGFFFNNEGIVVCPYSVIRHEASHYYTRSDVEGRDADYIMIRLVDGRQYRAELVGLDSATSLAVLRVNFIDPSDAPGIPIGNAKDTIVGEPVLFLGYNWITRSRISYDFGVISALRPKFPSIEDSTNQYFQVNVPQNAGNAGGVVVNTKGQVIAIMTDIAPYPDATEIHFALPIDVVKEVVDSILDIGEMHRPWFGMRLLEMNPQIERAYSLIEDMNDDGLVTDPDRVLFEKKWGIDLKKCLFTVWVDEDSPASDAGLREGDILLEFNGVQVKDIDELNNQIDRYRIGDHVTLKWMRREYAIWDPYVAEIVIEYNGQRDEESSSDDNSNG